MQLQIVSRTLAKLLNMILHIVPMFYTPISSGGRRTVHLLRELFPLLNLSIPHRKVLPPNYRTDSR
jgi:hypothetical protein